MTIPGLTITADTTFNPRLLELAHEAIIDAFNADPFVDTAWADDDGRIHAKLYTTPVPLSTDDLTERTSLFAFGFDRKEPKP